VIRFMVSIRLRSSIMVSGWILFMVRVRFGLKLQLWLELDLGLGLV
jgi:hypothetical protein